MSFYTVRFGAYTEFKWFDKADFSLHFNDGELRRKRLACGIYASWTDLYFLWQQQQIGLLGKLLLSEVIGKSI